MAAKALLLAVVITLASKASASALFTTLSAVSAFLVAKTWAWLAPLLVPEEYLGWILRMVCVVVEFGCGAERLL